MSSAAAASASRHASVSDRSHESPIHRKGSIGLSKRGSGPSQFLATPKSPRLLSSRSSSRSQRNQSSKSEIHNSEYDDGGGSKSSKGSKRQKLARHESYLKKSFRLLQEPKSRRRFEATVKFKEFCLHNDKERMKVDQLKPYVARVFSTRETSLNDEAMKLVLKDAIKKSPDEPEGILNVRGVVSAVIKYGVYEQHCEEIQVLFESADWSKDGLLQRHELRNFIQTYESTVLRSTEFVKTVLLFVTEDDINYILKSADNNRDGDIDLTEVVRAIGVWEELAKSKVSDFDKMHCHKCWNKGCAIS